MATLPRRYFTEDEYLLLEERAPYKSEYFKGEIYPLRELEVLSDGTVAMAGASPEHVQVTMNVAFALRERLKGRCRVYASDLRVQVSSTGYYAYPDVVVACGEAEFNGIMLTNPMLIVEVLSDSTADRDRNFKFGQFAQLDSFQEYVLVAQDRCEVEHRVRQEDGSWRLDWVKDLHGVLHLRSVGCEISLVDMYDGVLE